MVSYLEDSPLGGQELQLSQDASSSVASERPYSEPRNRRRSMMPLSPRRGVHRSPAPRGFRA